MSRWLGFGARREHPETLLVDVRPGVGDRQGDIRTLPFDAASFDGVECHHVIEHLSPEDGRRALSELYRVLAPGGVLEISCPDLLACFRTLATGNEEILLNIYSPHPEPAQCHRWGYTWASLARAVEAAGFRSVGAMPLTDPHEMRMRAVRP